ncbi:Fe-S-cluster formation regulator IscX/YfhJ [Aquimarina sp. EL_43]|uniref:hypothetical protein n=1 Tax=unclassified Aquimarina TaxID=2627091 RepID=UPI0018C8E06D|nr:MULTISPECIES: hypothetical protein [unclassified Aquimarina]MBG6133198.1 Fe-S-cluster formation regulator IscX/YfhJ [Aquimarina sp. EL_35]MBG6153356.1 Fe-S-cluster formation regulator IscX/YfhJ [Aquimarina sp. EL_32]MBG6171375.1 Fe-S-cluster formation regulator IscX/YfhJ [Aquimarina sp. EL_43]
MKRLEETELMLITELQSNISNVKNLKSDLEYYNEILGDSSFLLGGLLDVLLKSDNDWDSKRWIDDSLLTKIKLEGNKLSISGIMIWGIENITEQWTDPFYFEIKLKENNPDFDEYTFLFCDLDKSEISYEDFSMNRNYWNPIERNWKYIINQKNPTPQSLLT